MYYVFTKCYHVPINRHKRLERVNQLCSDTFKVQVIKESLSQGKVNLFREELANA